MSLYRQIGSFTDPHVNIYTLSPLHALLILFSTTSSPPVPTITLPYLITRKIIPLLQRLQNQLEKCWCEWISKALIRFLMGSCEYRYVANCCTSFWRIIRWEAAANTYILVLSYICTHQSPTIEAHLSKYVSSLI